MRIFSNGLYFVLIDFPDSDSDDPALDMAIQLSLKELHERKLSIGNTDVTDSTENPWDPLDDSRHSSVSSLSSGDFKQLSANEVALDNLLQINDENRPKTPEPKNAASENEASENKVPENEASENAASENEASENEASEKWSCIH